MRMSQLFTKTSKTAPADEVAKNAQLLIRAGYIHKEMAGVYTYLPLGKRVLDNIIQTSADIGMVSFDSYLAKMVMEGKVSEETALSYSSNALELKNKIQRQGL